MNADWVIVEPVDAELRPVPADAPCHTCLITNLANRVQPLIRYDLGDSITVRGEPCPCGNQLPAIHVEGRRDQVVRFEAPNGRSVTILPVAITTVLEGIPGLRRFQIVQTNRASLSLRIEIEAGADANALRKTIEVALRAFLARQGAAHISVELSAEPPRQDLRSGKFHQVLIDVPAGRENVRTPKVPVAARAMAGRLR